MAESQSDKRWLLLSGAPLHQNLWKPLSEKYQLCFVYDGVTEYAASLGVTVDNLNRYITADVQEHALTDAAHFVAKVVPEMPRIQERISGQGGSIPPDLAMADKWFPGYLLQKAQVAALMVGAFDQFLSTHDVAGCVVHEDVAPDMRMLVALTQARGLPAIHLPHAPCHLCVDGGPDIHRSTRAEWIGASGPRVAEFYAENGHDPAKIAVVGGAQWDGLYDSFITPDRDEARRVLGINDSRPALWYGATWTQTTGLRGGFDSELRGGVQKVLEAARALDAWLLITLHPNDGSGADEMYLKALREANLDGLVTRFHLPYIAAAADALITQGPSNLCVAAALQGVPACYLQTEGFDYREALPYRSDWTDLTSVVKRTLASRGDDAWQGFIAAYNAAHPDGNASGKIAEWIGGLCR
jgi:hypothetical protein